MPNADLIYNADIAPRDCCGNVKGNVSVGTGDCICHPYPVYPPADFPPPYPPYPPYPNPNPCPPPPPCPCPPPPEPKKTSTEGKICKLSKKAAIVSRMIDGLENKNKDFIMKVGDATYNFGSVALEVDGWKAEEEKSYAETAIEILTFELGLIKSKIAELSE